MKSRLRFAILAAAVLIPFNNSQAAIEDRIKDFQPKCPAATYEQFSKRADWGPFKDLVGHTWIDNNNDLITYDLSDCASFDVIEQGFGYDYIPRKSTVTKKGNQLYFGNEDLNKPSNHVISYGQVITDLKGGMRNRIYLENGKYRWYEEKLDATGAWIPTSFSSYRKISPQQAYEVNTSEYFRRKADETAKGEDRFFGIFGGIAKNGAIFSNTGKNSPLKRFWLRQGHDGVYIVVMSGAREPGRIIRFSRGRNPGTYTRELLAEAPWVDKGFPDIRGLSIDEDGIANFNTNSGSFYVRQGYGNLVFSKSKAPSQKQDKIRYFSDKNASDDPTFGVLAKLSGKLIITGAGYEYYYVDPIKGTASITLFGKIKKRLIARCSFTTLPDLRNRQKQAQCTGSYEDGGEPFKIDMTVLNDYSFIRDGKVLNVNLSAFHGDLALESADGLGLRNGDWISLSQAYIATLHEDWRKAEAREKRLARQASERANAQLQAAVNALPGGGAVSNPLFSPTPGAPVMPRPMTAKERADWNEVEQYKIRQQAARSGQASTSGGNVQARTTTVGAGVSDSARKTDADLEADRQSFEAQVRNGNASADIAEGPARQSGGLIVTSDYTNKDIAGARKRTEEETAKVQAAQEKLRLEGEAEQKRIEAEMAAESAREAEKVRGSQGKPKTSSCIPGSGCVIPM